MACGGCHLVWHKATDLRTHDHEPLAQAHLSADGLPVVHLFVFDPFWYGPLPLTGLPKTGPVRARFVNEAVEGLRQQLRGRGQELLVRWGAAAQAVADVARRHGAKVLHAYAEVCSEEKSAERGVCGAMVEMGVAVRLYHGFSLYHLQDLPFDPVKWFPKTYSGFRREVEEKCQVRGVGHEWGSDTVPRLKSFPSGVSAGDIPSLEDLGLRDVPSDPRAAAPWKGGEGPALVWLEQYIWGRNLLRQYVGATNTMTPTKCAIAKDSTSKLSPWLAHGCLSPRLVWQEIKRYKKKRTKNKSTYWLKHELIWRDFLRFGGLAWGDSIFKIHGIGEQMRGVSWTRDPQRLACWTEGRTGFPFVDCFMRELAATGYTTHCGRECTAWFAVRDLRLDWRFAAEYYEHILIDYEPTANWGNWAYRIAPTVGRESVTVQTSEMLLWARQHDPHARHVKIWLPELSPLPAEVALEPWRLLSRDLSPLFLQPWACPSCTFRNAPAAGNCEMCAEPREVEYGGFRYGADYPTPQYVEALCVKPKEDAERARQVDAQLAADGMAGVNLNGPSRLLGAAWGRRAAAGTARNAQRVSQQRTVDETARSARGRAGLGATPPASSSVLIEEDYPPSVPDLRGLEISTLESQTEAVLVAQSETSSRETDCPRQTAEPGHQRLPKPKAKQRKWKVSGLDHLRR